MLNTSKSEHMTKSDNQDDINQLQDIEETSTQTLSDQEKCIKGSCDCQPKTLNVISQEQELILDLLKKVDDSSIKQELYKVFQKSFHKLENKKIVSPHNINEILTRFDKKLPKDITIKDI